MGTHGGIGNPPPVFPTTGPPTVYGNSWPKNWDEEAQYQQQPPPGSPAWDNKPFVPGAASPAWADKPFGTSDGGVWGGALPSSSWDTDNAFGVPGISGSAGGGSRVSPPSGWGSANTPFIPPDVRNSTGGMTSSAARRNPFGFAGSGTDSLPGQSGVPIYGSWHPSSHSRASVDGLWYTFEPMPVPTVPNYGDDSNNDVDWFDPTTEENTRWNAAVGRGVVGVSSGSSAPTRKKKQRR